jgi:hypothetical protein
MTATLHDHDRRHGEGVRHPSCAPPPRSLLARFVSSPVRIIGLAVVAVLLIDAGGTDDGPGLCVFRRCTGGYCPGCGLTRASKHLVRGELGAAWYDHPWIPLLAVQAAVAAAVVAVVRRFRRIVNWQLVILTVGIGNTVLALGIWAIRLSTNSIPTPW